MIKSIWNLGLLSFIILFYTLWNSLRAIRSLQDWQTIATYGAPASYILISGLTWTALGLWLLWQIGKTWQHTPRAGIILSGLYWMGYWADRLAFQPSPIPNNLFSLFFSSALLLFVILLWKFPETNAFFTKETE
jgi:hypothetical protein